MTERIDYHSADGVGHIGINRPEKKNALTAAMYAGLVEAIDKAEADTAVRVLLIHGTDDCFTAGNDLQDFLNAPPTDETSPTVQFLKMLPGVQKPFVAAVAGPAIGIGTTLLLHCDLIYADPNSRFQLPFVNLGLCPEAGSSLLLPALVGHPRAAELLLLGEPFSATRAMELGLVNAVTPAGQAIATAAEKARLLADRPSAAVRLTKSLLKRGHARMVHETIANEIVHFRECLNSPEASEAFCAFFERRKPDFSKFV